PNRMPNSDAAVRVSADEVVESTDAGAKFYRLGGRVLVKQGIVECRGKRGVVRITGEAGRTRQLDVYLEEDVFVENGQFAPSGARAFVELATRGEVQIDAPGRPVVRRSLADDPLADRAK